MPCAELPLRNATKRCRGGVGCERHPFKRKIYDTRKFIRKIYDEIMHNMEYVT